MCTDLGGWARPRCWRSLGTWPSGRDWYARAWTPAPEAFTSALRAALGLAPTAAVPDSLAAQPGRTLVLIATYEALAPLDEWLRNTFLPQLSENTLVVLAGLLRAFGLLPELS